MDKKQAIKNSTEAKDLFADQPGFFEQELRELIKASIKQNFAQVDLQDSQIELEHPQDSSHGDWSTNVAMQLAGRLKQNSRELAQQLVDNVKQNMPQFLQAAEVAGPGFINFILQSEVFKQELAAAVTAGEDYGKSGIGLGQSWAVEHTSPNPNKTMHLGHLRNNVLGMAMAGIWQSLGVDITRDAIDNNRGIAIAKLMWGYLKFAKRDERQTEDIDYWYQHQDEWLTPAEVGQKADRFAGELYVKGSQDFDSSPEIEAKVRQIVVDWEQDNQQVRALWAKALSFVYDGQGQTLTRLGSKWDHVWHEHEIYQLGKQYVEEGLAKGVFKRTSDGAVITDFHEYGIPDTIVRKSDGTALYITQDLALTKLKRDKFGAAKLFWVVGPEQKLALQQVFAACEQLGIGHVEDYTHIDYGWMSIKGEGRMSSRSGNVIFIEDLLDAARDSILKKMTDADFDEQEKMEIAEKVGVGAVKYSILKVARRTDTAFDFESSLSFDGDSAPYLMYTYARCKSILRDGGELSLDVAKLDVLQADAEIELLRWLPRFGERVYAAGAQISPNLLCEYLYELAQKYNSFYRQHSVLSAEDKQTQDARLILTGAVAQILRNGLALLGIETVERM